MSQQFDAIVVGAGHNGLTTANYLALQGLNVCVLERRHIVGGAAVSEEFHPGYRNSIASYVVSLLRPEVVKDLKLADYGYETIPLNHAIYLDSEGTSLLFSDDEAITKKEFAKFSSKDYDAYMALHDVIDKVGDVVAKQWLQTPPKLAGGGLFDLLSTTKLGLDFYRLDQDARHRFMQLMIGTPDSMIERWFESDKVKAIMAQHCTPANYASLQQPGAAIAMLHHAVGQLDGVKGAWGLVKGGMGGITQAMASAAEAKGVTIKTGCSVTEILAENGAVTGVRVDSGEVFNASIIAANTDVKTTLLKLLGKDHLADDFASDISVIRQGSASLRMNLALRGLPNFAAVPGTEIGPQHIGTISIIEDKDHVERAFRSAQAGVPSDPPFIEALIPSTLDPGLTDEDGHHVMSLLCKYMPYELAEGKDWDTEKPKVVANIIRYLGKFITNLDDILVSCQCFTPLDLERVFGLPKGDICHARLEPDQLFSMRPHPQAAQYSMPVKGLYICGSGTHPGGGVTGAPGYNAAQRIIKDL